MSVENTASNEPDPEETIDNILAISELLNNQQLARLYTYIYKNQPVEVESIKDGLGLPHSTTYKYISELEEKQILTRQEDQKPAKMEVETLEINVETPNGTVTATPELIDAVGRQSESEDIRVFVERNGVSKLASALHYTRRVIDEELTQRTAAEKLDVHPTEAMTVITALQDVIQDHRNR
ncbi:transcriptional regulator TrmB [Halorutilales archaeon Cl-col2-1]